MKKTHLNLPDDSFQFPRHQNTKTVPKASLHTQNKQLYHRHIQNLGHHCNYLNNGFKLILLLFTKINSPSQSITIGLLAEFVVLRTKTAFVAGDVVVDGDVAVVTSGDIVVSAQG